MTPTEKDIEKAKKLYKKLGTDGMLRQNDPVETIAQALAEARREALNDILEEVSKVYHLACKQKEHDVRWCSYCENRRDGMDIVTDFIEKKRGEK